MPFVSPPRPGLKIKKNNQINTIKFDPLPFINKELPNKLIFKRTVHHLWEAFYRVNFHSKSSEHRIVKSYFVKIDDSNKEHPLTVYPEKPIGVPNL